MNVYDFSVVDNTGKKVAMDEYRGDVLLIVNTATECGFTPQYDPLMEMYKKYHGLGFEILDFPCNQFGRQAPGTAYEITNFCKMHFGVTFPQFAKIDVNGENTSPLFKYLKSVAPFRGFDMSQPMSKQMDEMLRATNPDYDKNSDIKWNFTKFLINRDGNVVARFEPTDDMAKIDAAVAELCSKK
ncbi:MAG: glutathione peroxidase [Alphaproteobacteria bacterium]|nr:glutathione peroxidase [Alphaproteobacteria bacterium]